MSDELVNRAHDGAGSAIESELVVRAGRGDRAALESLLQRHSDDVAARIRPQMPTRHQALLTVDDVMQFTLLDAFLKASRLTARSDAEFVAWLTAIANHNLIDAVRELDAIKRGGGARRIVPRGSDGQTTLTASVFGVEPSPSDLLDPSETESRLHAALERLPADYQAVVRGFDLEGRAIEAIARELGRSVGAAYMLRTRAHEQLRSALGKFFKNSSLGS